MENLGNPQVFTIVTFPYSAEKAHRSFNAHLTRLCCSLLVSLSTLRHLLSFLLLQWEKALPRPLAAEMTKLGFVYDWHSVMTSRTSYV